MSLSKIFNLIKIYFFRGIENTATIIRFYSRLPFPALEWEKRPYSMPSFEKIILWLPLAAFFISLPAVLTLSLLLYIGVAPAIAATFGIGMTTLMTGAFHEDGLADVADGFGGGLTIEQRLTIMGDSRLGTFGVCALIFSFAIKISSLAVIITHTSIMTSCIAIIITAIVSRISSLAIIAFIPPARQPEATYTADPFNKNLFWISFFSSLIIVLLIGFYFYYFNALFTIPFLTFLMSLAFGKLSLKLIRGQTGDVAGAAEQLCEIITLMVLSISFY